MSTVRPPAPPQPPEEHNWTVRAREYGRESWPPERLLPDREPNYVAGSLYVFGVVAIAAFAMLVVTGLVLSFKGPLWWHGSTIGRFFNDMHFWAVQAFFFAVFIHIFTVFFSAAWRNGRRVTWLTGSLIFFAALTTGLTGYAIVTSWESQLISLSAKDLINAIGLGGAVNLLDVGQMLTLHVVLLPALVGGLIVWHVLLVRRHGVVEPFGAQADLERVLAARTGGGGDGAPAQRPHDGGNGSASGAGREAGTP